MPIVNDATPPSSPRGYDKEIVDVTANTTLTENHRGRVLRVNSGSDVTLTLPRDLDAGFFCEVEQYGAGQIIFSAATGATLHNADSFDRTRAQYARAEVEVIAQNAVHGLSAVYTLSGDISDGSGTTASSGIFTSVQATNYKAADGTASIVVDDTTGAVNTAKTVNITGGDTNITTTSASTDGGASVEPVSVSTTMTGAGGVGGRLKSLLTVSAALGGWSNALKGEVVYGAAGKTTGLGSSVLAEMTLSEGLADGTYAPVEVELNLPTGALTGTQTSLAYFSVNGDDKATFDTNGFLLSIQGLTANTGKVLQTGDTFGTPAATLRLKVGETTYYLPLYAGEITTA